ncbi:MAG: hypothetical protein K2J38_01000 [Muribaculaceae bacterium]|nr:hypothetical protein [Muribaculaceae bacterium]
MKRILSYVLASTLLAGFATSCSEEMPVTPETGGGVTFAVNVPAQMVSRAFSDGHTATRLSYYVYDEDASSTNIAALNGTATFDAELKATVSLSLVSGKSYSVVFWADAPSDSPYSYDADTKDVTVTYGGVSQDESRDAFYAYRATFKVSGPMNETITLTRPFSQINIGTSNTDYAAAEAGGLKAEATAVTVKGVYGKLNLSTGEVSDATEATFTVAGIPADTEAFPYKPAEYKYLAMNYVLVGADKSTVDVEFAVPDTKYAGATFAAVPVQRNYRTNIFGNLLTEPADFNVIINPDYETPDYDFDVKGVNKVDENTYEIYSSAGIEWLAAQVNGGTDEFEGKTVYLTEDIDMSGVAHKPIGQIPSNGQPDEANNFKGVFDGQNHTISNLSVTDHSAGFATAGLFGTIRDAVIKNIVLTDVNISSTHYAGAVAAHMYGYHHSSVIENCHVKGGTIVSTPEQVNGAWDNGDKVGGIVGYAQKWADGSGIKNCSVDGVTISGYRDLGGLLGCVHLSNCVFDLSGNTVSNTNIIQSNENAYKGDVSDTVGEIVGNLRQYDVPGDLDQTGTTAINVTITLGLIANGVAYDETTKTYSVSNANGLRWISEQSNAGKNFRGETVVLTEDINLAGAEWTPIGNTGWQAEDYGTVIFQGTFDGNGKTVSNMTISNGAKSESAFIGHMNSGATLKNITFKDASVSGVDAVAVAVGMVTHGGANIEGVTIEGGSINGHHWAGGVLAYGYPNYVKDCKVSGLEVTCTYLDANSDGDKAGAVAGLIATDSSGKMINCHATDCTVSAARDAGQLAGAMKAASMEGCTATNVTVDGSGSNVRNELIGRVF